MDNKIVTARRILSALQNLFKPNASDRFKMHQHRLHRKYDRSSGSIYCNVACNLHPVSRLLFVNKCEMAAIFASAVQSEKVF